MARYWILSMVEENYLIAKQMELIGVSKRNKRVIEQMEIGDMGAHRLIL